MIGQLMRLGVDGLAIDHRELRTFDVGEELAVRPPGHHRNLDARLAERGQGLGQLQFATGVGSVEDLYRGNPCCRRGGRGRNRRRCGCYRGRNRCGRRWLRLERRLRRLRL